MKVVVWLQLETGCYLVDLVYQLSLSLPFSAYGELVFILIQGESAHAHTALELSGCCNILFDLVYLNLQLKSSVSIILVGCWRMYSKQRLSNKPLRIYVERS